MTLEQTAQGVVKAVVIHNGRLLLVEQPDGSDLPSGFPEPAESAEATAARLVYELTGYLVDGSSTLEAKAAQEYPGSESGAAVVCRLLTEDPSDGARLTPEQIHWVPVAAAVDTTPPGAVRDYLKGHTPV
ncbi:NUDIX domain-containing protein [Streptomyces sp. NPDC090032]|uniref:NUDIX domain-containing protein n=1 Tax=unclassified Streptomyces TaxID=2593676 RepID=UPI00371504C8